MKKKYNSRLIKESEDRISDQGELMDMLTELVEFIKKANPVNEQEDAEIQMVINLLKNKILNHPMFEEFKESGFTLQDNTLKLSDWSANLKQAASAYMIRKNKNL